MSAVLQVGNHQLNAEEVISLLTSEAVLPNLLRELVIEKAIAHTTYTPQELEEYSENLRKSSQYRLSPEQVALLAPRRLKLEKFKEEQWGAVVEAEFLSNKEQYDRILFSIIQSQELEVVQELYFRLQEGEATFAELAAQYSQGPEANSKGLVGPIEARNLHPKLAQKLRLSKPGQITLPFQVDQLVAIARLERYITTDFTPEVRQRLINARFEAWVQSQINQQSSGTLTLNKDIQLPALNLPGQQEKNSDSPSVPPSTSPEKPKANHANNTVLTSQMQQHLQKHRGLGLGEALLLSIIPFTLGGWSVAALFGFGTKVSPFMAKGDSPSQPVKAEVTPEPSNSVLGVSREEAFRVAVNNAMAAAELTQTAETPQEWKTVAQHWQDAIALMKVVPPHSAEHPLAQKKVVEYQGNLEYAQKEAEKADQTFQAGLKRATTAVMFTRTAQSLQDWQKAIHHWQEAISLMEGVQKGHAHYIQAQQKVMEYQAYLQFAQKKVR